MAGAGSNESGTKRMFCSNAHGPDFGFLPGKNGIRYYGRPTPLRRSDVQEMVEELVCDDKVNEAEILSNCLRCRRSLNVWAAKRKRVEAMFLAIS